VGQVFAIAVLSALDVGLLTAAVVLLGRPQPARQLGAYLIGGMGFSIAFGLAIVLALHGTDLLSKISRSTRGIVEVVVGALLIFVAITAASGRTFQWHPRRHRKSEAEQHKPEAEKPTRPSLQERALGNDSLWISWAAGAIYSLPGAYYLAGLALLAKVNASATTYVFAILGFNLVQFALIELPLIGLLVVPDRARSLTERLNEWMTAHHRLVVMVLAGVIGAYLLITGITDVG
jgi:hypothetical protein